jgi:RimJ/RimL family protein N-acetyltransferase
MNNLTYATLPKETLATRTRLSARLDDVVLGGKYIELKPIDSERDTEALFAVSNGKPVTLNGKSIPAYDPDELIWQYMGSGPFSSAESMKAYVTALESSNNGLAMCVFDRSTAKQVGVATFMNNYPEHLKIELGSIWYSPIVQRTACNTETIYLMLKHAFELGYRRVEWKCDALNERSRQAAIRLCFKFEGVQDFHMIVKEKNRDTAWFRILDREWADVRAILESKLQ